MIMSRDIFPVSIFERLARVEQDRMRISPFQGIHLPLNHVVTTWQQLQLDLESSRSLTNSLEKQPLILYSDMNDATVLLRLDVAMHRSEIANLETIAIMEGDFEKACILAQTLPYGSSYQERAFCSILLRREVPFVKVLKIARRLPNEIRSAVLKSVAFRKNLTIEEALQIVHLIPDRAIRQELEESVLKRKRHLLLDMSVEEILRIAGQIEHPYLRDSTLGILVEARSNSGLTVEEFTPIAREIENLDWRDRTYRFIDEARHRIALHQERPLQEQHLREENRVRIRDAIPRIVLCALLAVAIFRGIQEL